MKHSKNQSQLERHRKYKTQRRWAKQQRSRYLRRWARQDPEGAPTSLGYVGYD